MSPVVAGITSSEILIDKIDMKNALVKEVELLERVCLTLEGTRQTLDEDAKKLKQAQISHQEDRSRTIKLAPSRTREPEHHMIQLDQWPNTLDDSEATNAFELLYKDLKGWVEEHYASLVYAGLPTSTDTQRLGLGKHDCTGFLLPHCQSGLDILHTIHGELFKYLFISILSPFIVGTSNSSWDHHLRVVDKEIQKLCKPQTLTHRTLNKSFVEHSIKPEGYRPGTCLETLALRLKLCYSISRKGKLRIHLQRHCTSSRNKVW